MKESCYNYSYLWQLFLASLTAQAKAVEAGGGGGGGEANLVVTLNPPQTP
jgi:hypothetical protein